MVGGNLRVLRREVVRSAEDKKRVCDLELRSDGHIYIVDVEESKYGKRKYAVCIDELLKKLRE